MNAWQIIKRLFVVHKCASCRKILSVDSFDEALCEDCLRAYHVACTESCSECSGSARECVCQPKLLSSAGSLCLRKLFFYHTDKEHEPQNKLIYFIKHHSSIRASRFIAAELRKPIMKEMSELSEVDGDINDMFVVVNVPRSIKSKLEHGFDHAENIGKAISDELGIKYLPVIKRKLGGKEQKKLNAAERRKNMRNLMYADKKFADTVRDKYVILFDDVVTTGTSMESCIKVLRKLGVKGVICCCIATDFKKKSRR